MENELSWEWIYRDLFYGNIIYYCYFLTETQESKYSHAICERISE
jgi:hypothetical protein